MECGDCTLCCKLLETHDIPTQPGEQCKYCKENGCGIYTERPAECREYKCMWLQMNEVDPDLRPDKLHVIFERIADNVVCGLQDPGYEELSDLAKQQVNSFVKNGFSVGLIHGEKKGIFLAEDHTIGFVRGTINDCSELYRRLNRF